MTTPLKSALSLPPAAPAATGANTYSNLNGLAALKKDPNSPQAIAAVSQQIDALFLQMMLKSMRDASADVGEADSNEMGMYQDMFDKQIALTLSQHQSLGLGAQLTRQLSAAAAAASAAPAGTPAAGAANTSALPGSATPADADGQAADAEEPPTAAVNPSEFVSQVFPAIERAAQALGVSPYAMLAQAALETGWGKRMPRSADGTSSLNLFGIKADDKWGGPRIAADTVEFSGGIATVRRAAFRAYGSIEESVNDFARLLGNSPRYRDAVEGGADTQAYVKGIGRSGYATDPQYADKLNDILNSTTFRSAVRRRSVLL
ncbi:MAG: flagellar assembly peptidoglycan hydrolase FlgJ [Steroidobacteraceae bacterium]|jgi:flagellar protein FlgJ